MEISIYLLDNYLPHQIWLHTIVIRQLFCSTTQCLLRRKGRECQQRNEASLQRGKVSWPVCWSWHKVWFRTQQFATRFSQPPPIKYTYLYLQYEFWISNLYFLTLKLYNWLYLRSKTSLSSFLLMPAWDTSSLKICFNCSKVCSNHGSVK